MKPVYPLPRATCPACRQCFTRTTATRHGPRQTPLWLLPTEPKRRYATRQLISLRQRIRRCVSSSVSSRRSCSAASSASALPVAASTSVAAPTRSPLITRPPASRPQLLSPRLLPPPADRDTAASTQYLLRRATKPVAARSGPKTIQGSSGLQSPRGRLSGSPEPHPVMVPGFFLISGVRYAPPSSLLAIQSPR